MHHYRHAKMIYAMHARDTYEHSDTQTFTRTELASYVAECPKGTHLVFHLGRSPTTYDRLFFDKVATCCPETVFWEFGECDGEPEVTAVLSAFGNVPCLSIQFSDGKITMERLDFLLPLARRRYRQGLEFGAFNIIPSSFRDLVGALHLQEERFKTALVCVAASSRSPLQ